MGSDHHESQTLVEKSDEKDVEPNVLSDKGRPSTKFRPDIDKLAKRNRKMAVSKWAIVELLQKFIGEFVGTGVFCGFCMALGNQGAPGVFFGLALGASIYLAGTVSGGHINPAVSVAVFLNSLVKKLGGQKENNFCIFSLVVYLLAQLLGSMSGAALIYALLENADGTKGCTTIAANYSVTKALFIESFMTFVLVGTVLFGTDPRRTSAELTPVSVGLVLVSCATAFGGITGASLNPARSFGPAVVGGGKCWDNHWVYWVGPLMGSVCALIFYRIYLFISFHHKYAEMSTKRDQQANADNGIEVTEQI